MNKIDLDRYKVVIFDLGEVIIDLNPKAVIDGFADHFSHERSDYERLRELIVKSPELYEFEIGLLSERDFVESISAKFSKGITVGKFREIWNRMLLPIEEKKIELLKRLGDSHRVFFLSNTNITHQNEFDRMFAESSGYRCLEDLVEKAFYSHLVGMRKPESRIYQHVLEEIKVLHPGEVIFIDDRQENTKMAEQIGFNTLHLQSSDQLLQIFA